MSGITGIFGATREDVLGNAFGGNANVLKDSFLIGQGGVSMNNTFAASPVISQDADFGMKLG